MGENNNKMFPINVVSLQDDNASKNLEFEFKGDYFSLFLNLSRFFTPLRIFSILIDENETWKVYLSHL